VLWLNSSSSSCCDNLDLAVWHFFSFYLPWQSNLEPLVTDGVNFWKAPVTVVSATFLEHNVIAIFLKSAVILAPFDRYFRLALCTRRFKRAGWFTNKPIEVSCSFIMVALGTNSFRSQCPSRCCNPGLSNWRPAGRIRPAAQVDPAREAKLNFCNIVEMLTIIQ